MVLGALRSGVSLRLASTGMPPSRGRVHHGRLGLERAAVRFDHLPDQRFELGMRSPAELLFCFRRVADQEIDFGRAIELRVDDDEIAIVEASAPECQFAKL